jgi:glyoxylase-like metal-dependent hydrolase (beta-lactamase superfamily II)
MLEPLAPGVFAWITRPAGRGRTNAGVVVEGDGITVIDTMLVPSLTEPFATAAESFGVPVRRVILTSSHAPYVGGTARFRLAAVYGSPQISAHLDQPPNTAGYIRQFPDVADELVDLAYRPVSHAITQAAWLTPSVIAVPVTGQIAQNLVVQVPEANVVFAGAMATFGVAPLAFDGDPAAWADALDEVLTYGRVVVPGQGPVGGEAEVRALQAYLRACVAARGDVRALASGPWDTWACREHDQINVERAAMLAAGDPSPPPSMLRLLGLA